MAVSAGLPGICSGGILRLRSGCALLSPLNWHEIIDERSYEMDQVVAKVLRREPARLEDVVIWIERFLANPDFSIHSKDDLSEWLDLIKSRGLPGVLEALTDQTEEGKRMRQNSPFAIIMPPDERARILRQYEARRPRTRTASI